MHTSGLSDPAEITYLAPVLRVADLSRAIAFYRDRLGFAVEFIHGAFYASVGRDGCHIHLKCAPAARRDEAAFKDQEHADVCIGVASAETVSRTFASAGVSFVIPLRKMPYGAEFYVRDPDDYVLAFVESGSAATQRHC